MRARQHRVSVFTLLVLGASAVVAQNPPQQKQTPRLTFFVTSAGPGDGANLGGLAGADKHCQQLAAAAGAGDRTWRAYLSTSASGGQPAVNARDRIGQGPWHNGGPCTKIAQSGNVMPTLMVVSGAFLPFGNTEPDGWSHDTGVACGGRLSVAVAT